jgi:hypothetical protein
MYERRPILEVPHPDTPIWRYMDFAKYVSLLDQRAIFFTTPDRFADAFEGSVSRLTVEARERSGRDSYLLGKRNREQRAYFPVSCWHVNEGESEAMWRLYLKSDER